MAQQKNSRVQNEEIQNILGLGKFSARKSYYPELQETIKELKASEARYRTLSELSSEGIMIHKAGKVLEVNKAFCKIFGYKPEELLGEYVIEKIFTSETQRKIKNYIESNKTEKDIIECVKKDGTLFFTETVAEPMIFNNIKARVVLFRDVTEEREQKLALEKSEKKFKNLTENLIGVSYICKLDKNYTMSFISKNIEVISGYSADEFLSQKIHYTNIITPKYRKYVKTEITSAKKGDRRYNLIYQINTKSGSEKWIQENGIIVESENKKLQLEGYLQDITERIENEKELEKYRLDLEKQVKERTGELNAANKELQQEIKKQKKAEKQIKESLKQEQKVNELKTRFISTVSHEIRTPLTAIKSSSDLLQRYHERWDVEKKMEYLSRINSSVDYLTDLLENVLTMSRTESGKIVFTPGKVDIKTLIQGIVNQARLLDENRHKINLELSLTESEIETDSKLLSLIINNILSNALKYSPEKSEVFIDLKLDDSLILVIEDHGIGIPKESLELLFEPFYRAENAEKFKGSGLGLSIVKKTVDMIGGVLLVESELRKGTKFTIKLPLKNNKK